MDVIEHRNSRSFRLLLAIAGVYHMAWGISVVFFPSFWFRIAALNQPNYSELWQYIGMVEAIYGLGYLIAASNPLSHWRIVLLGFATKLFATFGFLFHYLNGHEPRVIFNMVLMNDLIWLIPFGLILYNAYKHPYLLDHEMIQLNNLSTDELSQLFITNHGNSLSDLDHEKPVMLIFLRHFGCIFCKETLSTIQRLRPEIEKKGTRIVLVNMLGEEKSNEELAKFNLGDLEYVADPECMLYKGFKLKRGTLSQLLGFKIWVRIVQIWFSKRYFNTSGQGMDIFQMPGIFLLYKGKVVKQYVHETAADIPPYLELATCDTCNY